MLKFLLGFLSGSGLVALVHTVPIDQLAFGGLGLVVVAGIVRLATYLSGL